MQVIDVVEAGPEIEQTCDDRGISHGSAAHEGDAKWSESLFVWSIDVPRKIVACFS